MNKLAIKELKGLIDDLVTLLEAHRILESSDADPVFIKRMEGFEIRLHHNLRSKLIQAVHEELNRVIRRIEKIVKPY